jgi:phage repressor protein C with HTH and peptisase S24 domain
MSTPAARLKHARKLRGLNQIELAQKAGVATGTVGNIEAGKRGIKSSAMAFARALQVSAEWLATGDGPIEPNVIAASMPSFVASAEGGPASEIELENNPDYPAVRRVSVKAQAGIAGFAIEDVHDTAPIVFRADWYKTHNYRPERLMALRVAGESMVPSLWPDDLIVVNTESTTPKDGVAFLVAYYGEVAVKRLLMDAGQWWLSSDNADQRRHPRKLCDDSTVLIGEVVYKQSERV